VLSWLVLDTKTVAHKVTWLSISISEFVPIF